MSDLEKAIESLEIVILDKIKQFVESSAVDMPLTKAQRTEIATKTTEATTAARYLDPDEGFVNYIQATLGTKSVYDFSDSELKRINEVIRRCVGASAIAENILQHCRSLIVGEGLSWSILPIDIGTDPTKIADVLDNDTQARTLHANWGAFCVTNSIDEVYNSWVNKVFRDGDMFLRIVPSMYEHGDIKAIPAVRFIDPTLLSGSDKDKGLYNGIQADPQDWENITGIVVEYTSGEPTPIPIEELIMDKRGTDKDVPRGLSLFYRVLLNLRRLDKNTVNVSVLTSILSAIAMVRTHKTASLSQISSFIRKNSDGRSRTNPGSGKDQPATNMQPGTVLDGTAGTEYTFPGHQVNTQNFIKVIELEAAIACAPFNLPWEWALSQSMPTSIDDSHPTVKRYRREQTAFFAKVKQLFWKVQLAMGVDSGVVSKYSVDFFGPSLGEGTYYDRARAFEIEQRSGALSPQTWAAKLRRNYYVERGQTIQHRNSKQPDEVMPGDAGNTNITNDQPTAGQGGNGTTEK